MIDQLENRIPSFLIGLIFISFLIVDMVSKAEVAPVSIGLGVALLTGLMVDVFFVYQRHRGQLKRKIAETAEIKRLAELEEKKPKRKSLPSIIAQPLEEDRVFQDLAELMRHNNLEMRLRRVAGDWSVAFLQVNGKVVRVVGTGSAEMILDALIKAEADFLEKEFE